MQEERSVEEVRTDLVKVSKEYRDELHRQRIRERREKMKAIHTIQLDAGRKIMQCFPQLKTEREIGIFLGMLANYQGMQEFAEKVHEHPEWYENGAKK